MTLIARAKLVFIYRAMYTSPNRPFPSLRPSSNMSILNFLLTSGLIIYFLFLMFEYRLYDLMLVLGVLGVFIILVSWFTWTLLRGSIWGLDFLEATAFSLFPFALIVEFITFIPLLLLPTILFLIFLTIIAPDFSYFPLFSCPKLEFFDIVCLFIELFVVYRSYLRLLFEWLVFIICFLLLLDEAVLILPFVELVIDVFAE